jgi:EmrB/QacA subfamily drug resistance transporter
MDSSSGVRRNDPRDSNEEEDVSELSGKTLRGNRTGRQPCSSSWTPLTGSSSSQVEATSAEAVPAAETDDRRRWLGLAVIVTAQFMVVLDISIVNVALPSIKTDLHFSQEGLQWVITAYAIFFGGFLLLGGRLADLLGRRRLFMAGVSLFTVSSLLNGLAWSEGSLIAFRSLQGLGAAMMSPAALSILTTTFQEGRDRNRALGTWGAVAGSGGAVGVLLGGVLTSAFSWPWIFFVNVPVGVAVIAFTPRLLSESRVDLPNRYFDVAGAATITSGLMLLVYGMTRAAQHGWSAPTTIGLLAASGVLIASFFLIESRSKAPLLPLRIFRLRTLAGSNAAALITTGAVFSQFFLLTLYMQQVLHYSALKTGVAYIGLTLTTIVLSAVSQGLVTRLGVRRVLPAGLLLSCVALVLYAQVPVHGHYFRNLFPGFIISGLGLAFTFIPMSIGALTGVRQSDAGIASGLISTSQQVGGAIGLAAATTIATTATTNYVSSHGVASAVDGSALVHGFQIAFYALAAGAAVGAVIAALVIESRPAVAESSTQIDDAALATDPPV